MGRPTKLTPEIIKAIAANIYPAGNYFEVACELAGIDASTGYRWLAIGEGKQRNNTDIPTALFREFKDAVHKANAQIENAAVVQWRGAFASDWHSISEYLARRFPERWKKVERVEATGKNGEPVKHIFEVIFVQKGKGDASGTGNPS